MHTHPCATTPMTSRGLHTTVSAVAARTSLFCGWVSRLRVPGQLQGVECALSSTLYSCQLIIVTQLCVSNFAVCVNTGCQVVNSAGGGLSTCVFKSRVHRLSCSLCCSLCCYCLHEPLLVVGRVAVLEFERLPMNWLPSSC